MKSTLYTHTLCRKVTSRLGNKLAQVFTSGNYIFVAPKNSKADGVIVLMDLCDEHVITEELRYDNYKDESMHGNMMKIIMRNFYITGRSREPYTPKKNKCEGHIRDLQ